MNADRVTGVILADATRVPSGCVVVAAGAGSSKVLRTLGDLPGKLPAMLAGKGVGVVFKAHGMDLPCVVRSPNRDFACGVHMVPRNTGHVYVGATNRISATPGAEPGPTGGELHALLHAACHGLHAGLRAAEIQAIQHGMRPLTADGYPLIGQTGLDGLHIATGTYRNGVLLAPAIAEVISAQLAGLIPDPELAHPFDPARATRADRVPPWPQIIERDVVHLASMLTDPGGRLPYDRQRELAGFLSTLLESP